MWLRARKPAMEKIVGDTWSTLKCTWKTVTARSEAWNFLEKMRLYALGDELVKKGFFMSDAEESDARHGAYEHTTERLNALWEAAIADATQARSFGKLCERLEVE